MLKYRTFLLLVALAAVVFPFSLITAEAHASDIEIVIPPPPPSIPAKFPQYRRCFVNGKRMACFGLQATKQLLLSWERRKQLEGYRPAVKKLSEIVKDQKKVIRGLTIAVEKRKKEGVSLRESNKLLRQKIARDEKRRRLEFIRNVLMYTGIGVGAAVVGGFVGYGIAKALSVR